MGDDKMEKDPFKMAFSDLEELVDKIRDVLECPVTIEDVNHRLLAYSTHDDQTDTARIATIISRKVPEKVINRLWKERVIPQLMQSGEPLRIPEIKEIGLGNRVAISIRNHNEVLGYIWAVEEETLLTESKLNLLKLAAQSARTEMLRLNAQKKKRAEGYRDFFWELLTGHFQSHDEIAERFEAFSIKPPSPFAVLVFRFKEEVTSKIEQNIIYLITTSQKVHITFHAAMGNEFIILAAPPDPAFSESAFIEFIHFFIDQMKTRFSIDHISGATGTTYQHYEKVEKSYQEALQVLRLKEQFPEEIHHVYSYQQLGIFRYLDAILEKKRLEPYEHPAIEKLKKYDLEHRTNLLTTLEAFIDHDSNVNETAKKLHIHMNTLNYRLKRITDIGEVDLKNTNTKLSLYLELKIRRIEKKSPHL
ncbi:CdaR family transcriptional regulator [Cytobacillus firmus]|uniref:PucR family transcriptional regulator n=1 Tax=Cytobacillus firmus TaxID=1399 RepID=UPI002161EA0B|nr:PucR family transcriptional regulator [Cytobacillus firmus]MCS0673162.1 PucR family transcriptional regulator [Cytobacillus firmus]